MPRGGGKKRFDFIQLEPTFWNFDSSLPEVFSVVFSIFADSLHFCVLCFLISTAAASTPAFDDFSRMIKAQMQDRLIEMQL